MHKNKIKKSWNIYTHKKEKEKSAVIGHNAYKDFTCFDFLNNVPFLKVTQPGKRGNFTNIPSQIISKSDQRGAA